MREWGIIIGVLVVLFCLHFALDSRMEKRNRLDQARKDYTGIKDEENTDDFLPW